MTDGDTRDEVVFLHSVGFLCFSPVWIFAFLCYFNKESRVDALLTEGVHVPGTITNLQLRFDSNRNKYVSLCTYEYTASESPTPTESIQQQMDDDDDAWWKVEKRVDGVRPGCRTRPYGYLEGSPIVVVVLPNNIRSGLPREVLLEWVKRRQLSGSCCRWFARLYFVSLLVPLFASILVGGKALQSLYCYLIPLCAVAFQYTLTSLHPNRCVSEERVLRIERTTEDKDYCLVTRDEGDKLLSTTVEKLSYEAQSVRLASA